MSLELDAVPPQGAREDYRTTFGWPVEWHRGGWQLITGSGVGAVLVSRRMSQSVLAGLVRQGCSGPALSLPTRRELVTAVLVETDDFAVPDMPLPSGITVLPTGSVIPLPGAHDPSGLIRWIVEPDSGRRWLPSLAAVLTTSTTTASGTTTGDPGPELPLLTSIR